jgi:cell wall-associated NlpC family hydrolase
LYVEAGDADGADLRVLSLPIRVRHLPRCVALVLLVALVLAVPAGAAGAAGTSGGATDTPGVTDPTSPSTDATTTTSSTTTTTTKPAKSPPAKKPSTKKPPATKSTDEIPAGVPVDDTPTAGPPELAKAGVLLPDDSLVAAIEELGLERARVDLIGQRRTELDALIITHAAKLRQVREIRKREQAQRLDRAVATYRGQSSGWQLGVIVERGLAEERAVYLVAAADAAARQKIKSLLRAADRLEAQLDAERTERVKVEVQLGTAVERVNRLLDKLAASNGTITLIDGVLTYVPTGPSPVALLADAADQELSRLLVSEQPPAADAKWLAASHALATEIARGKGLGDSSAAALEASWAATPTNVVHAMLFALRQVGKAYVYATAGPVTFDCSGLTKAAYAQIRLGLPHFSGAQLHAGIPVTAETLRPGDLLTYGPDGSEHVTMYIGDNLVVEAKGRAYGVIVSPARVDPTKGFAGASRIVP